MAMSAPRMNPTGFMDVTTHATMQGRIKCLGYGEHDKAISPGDLVLIGSNWMRENSKLVETEFVLQLKGKDIEYFIVAATTAKMLYEDNKHWLEASSSQPGIDYRSRTVQRQDSTQYALQTFLANRQR